MKSRVPGTPHHAAYAFAAGSTRCFLVGYGMTKIVSTLRVSLRPGCGVLVTSSPAAVGVALSTFCAVWHATKLLLMRPLSLSDRSAASAAGAIAGSSLALVHPAVAGLHTELHAFAVLSGANLAWARMIRWVDAQLPTRRSRLRWRRVLSLLPIPAACMAGWLLLMRFHRTSSSAIAGNATSPLPEGRLAWLSSLAAREGVSNVINGGEQASGSPIHAMACTLVGIWRRSALTHVRANAPGIIIYRMLRRPREQHAGGDEAATDGTEPQAKLPPPQDQREGQLPQDQRPQDQPEDQPHQASLPPPPQPCPLLPSPKEAPGGTCWSGKAATALRSLLLDAAATGGVSTAFAAVLHRGPTACALYGWAPGLALVGLRPTRRADLSARLCYQAALSTALTAVRSYSTNRGRGVWTLSRGSVGMTAVTASSTLERVMGALLLGASAAAILYAHAPGSQKRRNRGGARPSPSSEDDEESVACFLLGFDDVHP